MKKTLGKEGTGEGRRGWKGRVLGEMGVSCRDGERTIWVSFPARSTISDLYRCLRSLCVCRYYQDKAISDCIFLWEAAKLGLDEAEP